MNSTTHITVQSILSILSAINVGNIAGYVSFLPPKYSALIIVLITCTQSIIGWMNHYYTPDGTKISNPGQ